MTRLVICLLVLVSNALVPGAVYAAQSQPAPNAAAHLPDFSGWWEWGNPGASASAAPGWFMKIVQLPFLPEARLDMDGSTNRGPRANAPFDFCRPTMFSGITGITAFEFLFSPGRVTLTSESGLIRRIYTDGRKLPKDPDISRMGTSIGYWQGSTLVVETTGLWPTAHFPFGNARGPMIGKNVKVTERIRLKAKDSLEVKIHILAPDMLSEPVDLGFDYHRNREHQFHEQSDCNENDRSIDPITKDLRFDGTPPADLPPPPSP